MSKGRRVSFYATPRHIRLVSEWLINKYEPTTTILGNDVGEYRDRLHAKIIGEWLLEQLAASRQFKQRPVGIILTPMALKWLARNLPTWKHISPLHGPLGSFSLAAGRSAPSRVGRPALTAAQIRMRLSNGYSIDDRFSWRLRARLKRTNLGQ